MNTLTGCRLQVACCQCCRSEFEARANGQRYSDFEKKTVSTASRKPEISLVPGNCFLEVRMLHPKSSLRGRHSKGKGKGIRARDHARGSREKVPFLSPSRTQIPPSPSPFNACHARYPKPYRSKFFSFTLLKITTNGKKTGCRNFRWLMIYLPRAGYPRLSTAWIQHGFSRKIR